MVDEVVELAAGRGRSRVTLRTARLGPDLVVFIGNMNAHIGAVAVGEYDKASERTSVSVHTRLGHKDDELAKSAAYEISKATKRPVCVIAGVHVENITAAEIARVIANAKAAVQKLIDSLMRG